MDWREQERERGITITAAATSFEWQQARGSPSSTPPATSTSPSRSSAACGCSTAWWWCSDAVSGVEPQSETVWHQADKFHVPRICFINKMDRVGADFSAAVAEIRQRLGANPVPLELPIGAEDAFVGAIDLVRMRALHFTGDPTNEVEEQDIPADLAEAAAEAREHLLEAVAEVDDAIAEKFLEGQDIPEAELKTAHPGRLHPRCRWCRSCAARRCATRACGRCSTR